MRISRNVSVWNSTTSPTCCTISKGCDCDMKHYYWPLVYLPPLLTQWHIIIITWIGCGFVTWVSLPQMGRSLSLSWCIIPGSFSLHSSLGSLVPGTRSSLHSLSIISQYHWVWSDLATCWSPQSLIVTATVSQAGTCSHWHKACSTHNGILVLTGNQVSTEPDTA